MHIGSFLFPENLFNLLSQLLRAVLSMLILNTQSTLMTWQPPATDSSTHFGGNGMGFATGPYTKSPLIGAHSL